MLHALEADRLASELTTSEARREYVKSFYNKRPLAGPAGFDDAAAEFMAQPFEDAGRFRASLRLYEALFDEDKASEPVLLEQPNEVETMILYGVQDKFVGPKFTQRMEIASPKRVGPFLIERSGHFVQFERFDIFNSALVSFCRDLLAPRDGTTSR
jgi:pimeloyl-ACP methyl ester carboxylesterase